MVDQWGRPTFNDGMQLAQGIMYMQRNQQDMADKKQEKQDEQEIFAVYNALQSGEQADLSQFSDKAKYLGAKMRWGQDISKLDKQIKELQVSNEGRQQKMLELQEVDAKAKKYYQAYQAARRSGNEQLAREIGKKFNNEVAYNGMYVEPTGDGKLKVQKWDGSDEVVDDPPIDFYDNAISGYMNVPQEEMQKRMLGGEQLRMQKNHEIISQAEPAINDKGQIIYKVPSGTWGKDGKPRGAFYVNDPVNQIEIPPEQAKGFKSFDVAKNVKSLTEKKPVNPANMVTTVGPGGKRQQGLIMQGADGNASVEPIQGGGGLQPPPQDPSKQKSAYELKLKQLQTVLMEIPSAAADDFGTADNSMDAKIQTALQVVQKAQQDPKGLSPEEQQILPAAQQAVQMYREIQGQQSQQNTDPVSSQIAKWKQIGMQFTTPQQHRADGLR